MGDPISGDAILDWLVHNAYHIELKGESMRRCAKRRRQGLQTKKCNLLGFDGLSK
ncbi:ATP-binding protein [Pseudomonas syringae]|uniref:ATP-binding protein n=1 Tax=Pseudomonas syringae TaxID=317 RepID=UPI0035C84C5E